jgi:hypothetical protein
MKHYAQIAKFLNKGHLLASIQPTTLGEVPTGRAPLTKDHHSTLSNVNMHPIMVTEALQALQELLQVFS